MEKERDQKTRCSFWCCSALLDSIPNTHSNGLLFFPSSFLFSSSFHRHGFMKWAESLVLVHWSKVFYLNERKKHKKVRPLFLHCFGAEKPQDASWRRPPPPSAVSSLVKGAMKRKQRGKVIFCSCLSILLAGSFYFLLCTFIKLIIILVRAPHVKTNRVFVPSPLQFFFSFFSLGKKEVVLTSGLPFTNALRKPDESLFEKNF